MKTFGGTAFLLDRNDINTDEIIPAKYLTESSKLALKPHLLEDLLLGGVKFDNAALASSGASVLISRRNFGCGSSREHAVWALEINNINLVIAESFARIFRQNMFNCGILAIELAPEDIKEIFARRQPLSVQVDIAAGLLDITAGDNTSAQYRFSMNAFDRELVASGGWLEYADSRY